MGYNTKVIKVDNAKKPSKPKDVIVDPKGQYKYPGQVTKIPSNQITMGGINYPVLGIDDLGNQQMMYPGGEYVFPGSSVTEYPQMMYGGDPSLPDLTEARRGGLVRGRIPRGYTNKNIQSSINEIMRWNETLYGKPGRRFYNPNNMNPKKKQKGGSLSGAPHNGQPTAQEFFDFGPYPSGPVGFYMQGGMNLPEAFPQQPTYGYMFNGENWIQKYLKGGTPCMECGGTHMQEGGVPAGYHMMPDGTMMADNEMPYAKKGWIQKATASIKRRGTEGVCTGSKFGSASCPPGSKRYNLAKTFRAMAKKQMGGANDLVNDVNEDSYIDLIKNNFMSAIKNNTMMSLADDAAEKMTGYNPDMSNDMQQFPMAQMGMNMIDYGYNPDMMNQSLYADKYYNLKNKGQQALGNLYGATADVFATQNPYMEYSAKPKAQNGVQVSTKDAFDKYMKEAEAAYYAGTPWQAPGAQNNQYRNTAPNQQGYYNPTQGYDYAPMNNNPYVKRRTNNFPTTFYNPENTYLKSVEAKKRFFGPGARKVKMTFRSYGEPGVGAQHMSPFDRPGYSPTEDYKAPNKRMSYDAEVEDLRQQYELNKRAGNQAPVATRPKYPFAPEDTSGVPYLNPQRAAGPDQYPFAPQMQDGGNYQEWDVTGRYRPGYDPEASANWLLAGTAGLTSMFNAKDRMKTRDQMMKNTLADNQFYPVAAGENMGKWNWTGMSTGMIDPYKTGEVIQQRGYQEGGEYDMDENEIEEFLRNGGSLEYLD